MGGIAEQRHPAVRPSRQRIAVAHRIFPELAGCLDQVLGIDHGNAEAPHMRHQVPHAAGIRPVLLPGRRRIAVADPRRHRPIGELAVRPRPFGDRIDDELRGEPAGDDHRAAGEERRPVDRAAPQHDAVPSRGAFVGKQRLAHPGMDAVAADQHVAARGGAVAGAVEEIGGDAAFVLGYRRRADGRYGGDFRRAAPAPPDRSRHEAGRGGSRIAARRSRRRARAARARSPGRTGSCRTARGCGSRPRRGAPAGRARRAP